MKSFLTIYIFLSLFIFAGYADIKVTDAEKSELQAGNVVIREIKQKANLKGKTYEAIIVLKAEKSDVLKVLQDYPEYSKFMPNVQKVAVFKKTDESVTLNYTLELAMGIIKKYRVKLNHAKKDKSDIINWKLVKWKELAESETISDTTGYWQIEEFPGKPGYLIILYHVYTDPGKIPFGLGWITDMLTKDSLPEILKKTKERVLEKVGGK